MDSESLLRVLADGRPHSCVSLAACLGASPSEIERQAAKLERWGWQAEALPGESYRLPLPLDLLDADSLAAALRPVASRLVARLDLFAELGSTNSYLLSRVPEPGRMNVCLAEFQNAGRGRRGRRWTAPFASGLCLSAGWQFAETPPELPALTLAIGVAARRVLERLASLRVALKWPNDLVWNDRKLGGILVETVTGAGGGCYAVAGLGLNVALPPASLREISDWPKGATDLKAAMGGSPPRRAVLAAALIESLAELFSTYGATGFSPYRGELAAADYLNGRRVSVASASEILRGTARGLDADGALRVEVAAGCYRRVVSGEVSVRPGV
ncbi:MAG TPA: biotin--[acetyl-CoA-carboxylase] ligase [Gammaproteobacteria bacterium]|nr:biotin--[acetyl-CoA-carboxylase] ligase [Gammaproteobacteria bacterium]